MDIIDIDSQFELPQNISDSLFQTMVNLLTNKNIVKFEKDFLII